MKTWFYDLLKPIVRAYYFLVRGIRATGTENVASPGGYILCSNHVSASDPFVLATCVRRRLHFMAKAELFKNRIVGGFISAIGAFPLAMQMQHVPKGKNVFELNAPSFRQCRNLGANSARAIKKMPFKPVIGDEPL